MRQSIIAEGKRCYICGTTVGLEKHHCMFGSGHRKLADKYGLTVWLCAFHHRDTKEGVHGNRELDLRLKRVAQITFEAKHGHELWMKCFGRDYL